MEKMAFVFEHEALDDVLYTINRWAAFSNVQLGEKFQTQIF
jgi:hypothetical protein